MFGSKVQVSTTLLMVLLVLALFGVMYAQSAKPVVTVNPAQAPAPVPLLSNYPQVRPDFLARYPNEPVEKVVQANAAEVYRTAILQQIARIDALEKRVAELETLAGELAKAKAADPNAAKPFTGVPGVVPLVEKK
jgi:hypothetical protein